MKKKQAGKKVCVMTTVHHPYDGRIYHKQCRSIKKAGYDVQLIAPEPDEFEANDIPLITIAKTDSRIKRLFNTFKVFRIARKTGADLYHFHDPELMLTGVALRLFTRKPVIYDIHEHYPYFIMDKDYLPKILRVPIRMTYELMEKMLLPCLSGVIYTNSLIGKRYKKYKSCLIANYPPKELFPEPQFELKDHHLFLYLGYATDVRGVKEIIEAISIVVKTNQDAKLIFVGPFQSVQFEKEMKQFVTELHLKENVEFVGKVAYEKVNEHLQKSTVGLLPYLPVLNHTVSLPNKLSEYMATGNAIIATNFPQYAEMVNDGESGLLVDPTKPTEIAEAMLKCLENPDRTREMGERGRKSFEDKYNWQCEEEKLLAFYKEILQVNRTADQKGTADS